MGTAPLQTPPHLRGGHLLPKPQPISAGQLILARVAPLAIDLPQNESPGSASALLLRRVNASVFLPQK